MPLRLATRDPATVFASTLMEAPPVDALDSLLLDDAPPGDDRPLVSLPTIGRIGRYELKHRLGEGGLGCVYAAWDPVLSREVALKTLSLQVTPADAPAAEALFLQEARAAASLTQRHIVTIFDAGASDQGLYIAMERLRGRDLRQALAEGWRPTPDQAAQTVRRIAEALGYAHAHGVVHCDVKPANIFLAGDTPKLLDFGIARLARPIGPADAGRWIGGSPAYMAPEVLQGALPDGRSDVYSLGVVLQELLTGRRPTADAPDKDGTRLTVAARSLLRLAEHATHADSAQRLGSASHFAQALRVWQAQGRRRPRQGGRLRQAWPLGLLLLGAGALVWTLTRPPTAPPPKLPVPLLAETAAAAPPVAAEVPPSQPAPALVESAAAPAATPAAPTPAAVPKRERPRRLAETPPPRDAGRSAAIGPPLGVVQLAVSPWAEVEVNGTPAGIAPPLSRLSLPEGVHTVVLRNADFPPHQATVTVSAEQPVVVRHRFGP